jgi:hypothetical protein
MTTKKKRCNKLEGTEETLKRRQQVNRAEGWCGERKESFFIQKLINLIIKQTLEGWNVHEKEEKASFFAGLTLLVKGGDE